MPPNLFDTATPPIGLCIRDFAHRVSYQNRRCQEICGDQHGRVCAGRWFAPCSNNVVDSALAAGAFRFGNVRGTNGQEKEVVVINAAAVVTTILFEPQSAAVHAAIECLGLSKREAQVLERMLAGVARSQIAAELDVSEETVKTHIRRITSRLPTEVMARIDAVRRLRRP